MSTLYLDRKGTSLKREGRALAVYQGGERYGTVPLNLLERVVMRGSVALDTGLLGTLANEGIAVTLLSGRYGRRQATLVARAHADAARRIAQYQRYQDAEWRALWSRRLVHHKLLAQIRLLRYALTQRPDRRYALTGALGSLTRLLQQVRGTSDIARLRGLEGAAAAAYFAGLTQLFADSLGFTGRNRRPPRDPVNAALSLAYTLLHGETAQTCHSAGLDPLIGFYHELAYGRESLASDLLEPLRPRVDRWVWNMFRYKRLRAEDFSREGQACLLGKTGRKTFFAAYEAFARPLRRLLRRVTQRLVAALVANKA